MENLRQLALNDGFSDAAVIDADKLTVVPEYRKFCEENRCGNFGRNYSCPPYCGTVSEMSEKMKNFSHALILRTDSMVSDSMDGSETKPLKKAHSAHSMKFVKALTAQGLLPEENLRIMAGPCSLCASCVMPSGGKCPFPSDRASCLSAYSIDVGKMAEEAGMVMSWDKTKVSFFSICLF